MTQSSNDTWQIKADTKRRYDCCYYLDKSSILILLTPCIHQKYFDLLYLLLDFNKKVFTTIDAPNFRLTEIDRKLIRIDIHFRYSYDEQIKNQISKDDGKLIDLTKLEWHDLKNIEKTCSLVTKNNR